MIVPAGELYDHNKFTSSDLDFLVKSGINEFIVEARGDHVTSDEIYNICLPRFRTLSALKKERDFIHIGVSFMEQNFPAINEARSKGEDITDDAFMKAVEKEGEKTASAISKFASEGAEIVILSDMSIWKCLDLGSPGKSVKMLREKPFSRYMAVRDAFWNGLKSNEKETPGLRTYLYPLFPDNRIRNQLNPGEFCYYKSVEKETDVFNYELWTGPVAYSTIIDDVDFARFSINNPLPVKFFDNSLTRRKEDMVMGGYSSRYPGKAATGSPV